MSQYRGIIENVDYANSLCQVIEQQVDTVMWNVVSGKLDYNEGRQYALIDKISADLDVLERNASSAQNGYLIEVSHRTLQTLEGYFRKIDSNIVNRVAVRENEKILDEIRSVSALLYDLIQDFITSEIELAAVRNQEIKHSTEIMNLFQILFFAAITTILLCNYHYLNKNIGKPILRMNKMASKIAMGDLSIRIKKPEVSELDDLTDSLNIMVEKIDELIESNVRKQINLQKAEMKALQAQISPHFMYNTLEAIISLAENEQNEEVVTTTVALSNFFRTSLSKGRDWITVEQEISHVVNYLAIQKVRYGALLDYTIQIDPRISSQPILKLILQPLVENAIYHGIKGSRRGGCVVVKGWQEENFLCFSVADNGAGMTEQALETLRACLYQYDPDSHESGYGLYNVHKRITLYYDIDNGLEIQSEQGVGTTVTLRLPVSGDDVNIGKLQD